MKRSQLQKIIHEEVKAALSEAASPEAARLHAMTGCGQDAAQDFIDENGLDGRKLADYVQQNMRTNSTLKYDVRDYISGGKGTVGGEKNLRDKFINQFKMQIKEQSNPELDKTVGQFVSALAKKYSYKSSDAVMAIFEALKRLGMLDKSSNYKAPPAGMANIPQPSNSIWNEGTKSLKEYSTNNFKAAVPTPPLPPAMFASLMPKTSKTVKAAAARIKQFEGKYISTHSQYYVVEPKSNMPDKPTYQVHQLQHSNTNVTMLTIFDKTGGKDDRLGAIYVDTDTFLNEAPVVFNILKRVS
jgi:hypothetical protein